MLDEKSGKEGYVADVSEMSRNRGSAGGSSKHASKSSKSKDKSSSKKRPAPPSPEPEEHGRAGSSGGSDTDLQSWSEIPSIAHFCSLFRQAFDLLEFDIQVKTFLVTFAMHFQC